MKRSLLVVIILMGLFSNNLWSQTVPCIYRLELKDELGNGWNGAQLLLSINQQEVVYTLLDGDSTSFYFPVIQNDQLEVRFSGGDADEEVSFALFTEREEEVFSETGIAPFEGEEFSTFINCPTCPTPPLSSVSINEVFAVSGIINWVAPDPEGQYLVELGLQGIEPGAGDSLYFQGNTTGMLSLQEKTAYTFYLSSVCANGDTSLALGPFDFETSFIFDVGAGAILEPFTDCNLPTNDTVVVRLDNFGAEPQSLIPFEYAVNGEPISIDMPRDGIYTGVLSKDSFDIFQFDATYDFSIPGEYFIEVWTAVEDGDSDPSNDTTSVTVFSIPTISSLPYAEDFEGSFSGWTVGDDSENSSWQLGVPTGGVINRAATGTQAWVTNLNGIGNDSELSYLLSPCMDLSGLGSDPLIAFQVWTSTEDERDQFWLESSIDGGNTWSRVRDLSYDTESFSFAGDNPLTDWVRQYGVLSGLAGEADVRLRFAYFSDFATQLEGVGLDNIRIYEQASTDLLLGSAFTNAEPACVTEGEEFVELQVTNVGQQSILGFEFNYQINGGLVFTQQIDDVSIDSAQSDIIAVNIPVDTFGVSNISSWISVPGDGNPLNDTLRFQIVASERTPFSENFESGTLPGGWTANSDAAFVTNGHGNSSFVLSQNLILQSPVFNLTSPFIGPIVASDTLRLDYRFVDFMNNTATNLGTNDRLEFYIIDGCSGDADLVAGINQSNHTPTTDLTNISIPLDDYVGRVIQLEVRATWGGGNYWLDLDNFQIPRCDGDLNLDVMVTESLDGSRTTSVVPLEGKGPFAYEWSSGETSNAIPTPLSTYSVTVTDQFGCTGTFEQIVSSVEEIEKLTAINLYPNPANGLTQLQLSFRDAVDAQIQVINAMGQPVLERMERKISQATFELNLNNQPAGIYFVRVLVDDQVNTKRLLLKGK